jgi:hypothetical protein
MTQDTQVDRVADGATVVRAPLNSADGAPATQPPSAVRQLLRLVGKVLLGAISLVVLLAGAGALYEAVASTQDAERYAPPGRQSSPSGR